MGRQNGSYHIHWIQACTHNTLQKSRDKLRVVGHKYYDKTGGQKSEKARSIVCLLGPKIWGGMCLRASMASPPTYDTNKNRTNSE